VLGDSRDDLAHSRQEARAVAQRFATEPLLGPGATKARLLAELAGKDLIHLACHGRFDTGRAGDSAVLLAPEAIARDGELTVEDIFQLRLDANLVTLSACQSGVSDTRPGDELIGLSRAVLYAGAPSIVVSLWEVDDLSTSLLMNHFYDRLRDGAALAEALRDAQLRLAALTTRELVEHCERELALGRANDDPLALGRVGDDPLAAATLRLDRAGAMAAAGDIEPAIAAYREALAGLDPGGGVQADRLRARARRQPNLLNLKREARPVLNYGTRPFAHPYYWAPFVLVGDWR
jgi:CHAT domain-containing protein